MLPAWYLPPPYKAHTGLEIISSIARDHGLTADDLTGPSRVPAVCVVRRCAMKALRAKGWSTPRIGRLLNRDHSTVVHGLRRAG